LTWVVIRIVVGNRSEGGVSKLCVSTAQWNDVARRVTHVEGLSGELQVGPLRHGELPADVRSSSSILVKGNSAALKATLFTGR
jgi:hypothetical protein